MINNPARPHRGHVLAAELPPAAASARPPVQHHLSFAMEIPLWALACGVLVLVAVRAVVWLSSMPPVGQPAAAVRALPGAPVRHAGWSSQAVPPDSDGVYDAVVVAMTTRWYAAAIEALPAGAKVLDVGIGTGAALLANTDAARAKGLIFTGVDYDGDYVRCANAAVAAAGADDVLPTVLEASIYEYTGGPFDAAYFSGSLMIMPDKAAALAHVATLLKPGGVILVTQTIEARRNVLLEWAKPMLKFVTTIDFGSVTYLHELEAAVREAGLRITSSSVVEGSDARAVHLFRIE